MSNRKHLLYMGIAAVVVLGGLWVAGVPLERAAPWALFLACPLMMVVMMLFMDHGSSPGHQAHGADAQDELRRVDEQYRR
jgi:hypothetical protein